MDKTYVLGMLQAILCEIRMDEQRAVVLLVDLIREIKLSEFVPDRKVG